MQKNALKSVAAVILAVIMMLSVMPLGVIAEAIPTRSVDNIADFAATQEGTAGQYYYDNYNIDFEWCVWFTTYCASNLGLCGTPSNTTGGVFPPVERSTWEALNWAATGVPYQVKWMTDNDKGAFYHFGVLDYSNNGDLVPVKNAYQTTRSDYIPQKGDLIYFDWEHDSYYNHVAIVYDYNASNGNVVYIGGNQGTGSSRYTRLVSRVTISSSSIDIVGYLRTNNFNASPDNNSNNVPASNDDWKWWAQGDSRWGSISMGGGPNTMFSSGCLVTSLTKAGIQSGCVSDSFTPYNLVTALNNNGGFDYYGNLQSYTQAAGIIGNGFSFVGETPINASASNAVSTIMNYVRNGEQVIMCVTGGYANGSHFVLVDNELSLVNNTVYMLNSGNDDPASGQYLVQYNVGKKLVGWYDYVTKIERFRGIYSYPNDTKPSKPTNLVVKTGIDTWVGWNPCTNTDSYDIRVYRQGETEAFMTIWSVNTTYCSCHLDPGTYRVTVCSVNETTHEWTSSDYTSYFTVSETYEYLPSNIVISGGHMYALYNYDMGSWSEAEAFCEARGGHLATISSASENELIYNLVKNTGKTSCRIGANKLSGSWKWVTNESFSYTNWANNQPDNYYSNERVLEFYTDSAAWNDNAMVTTTSECFVMEIELDSIAPAATVNYGGSTYLRYDVPLPWKEAEAFCEYLEGDGHLAVITTSGENNKIKGLINGASGSKFLIGASDAETEGTWKWVNDETFNYNDWASGQPDNAHSVEDFALIDGSSGWYDTSSAFAGNIGFICEMEGTCDHILQHVSAVEPTCTEDGHISYWFCPGCGKCYTDEAGENEISIESTIIPATGHTFVDEDVPATCINYAGVRHTCTVCGYSYVDYVGEFSDWSTEYPVGIDEDLIESRTEYRYRDYETTTSYETSMDGWTRISGEWVQNGNDTVNYVASWPSGFNTSHSLYSTYHNTPQTASETETDKIVINSTSTLGWIYWHWCRGRGADVTGGPTNSYIDWEYNPGEDMVHFDAFYSTTNPSSLSHWDSNGGPGDYYQYSNSNSCNDSYFWFCLTVFKQTYTTYKKLFTYARWSDWSEWSPDPVEPTDTREVETRTVYRYVTGEYGDHVWNSGVITTPCTHEHDGEMTYTCTRCGATKTEPIPRPATYTVTYFVDGEQYAQQLYWENEEIALPEYTAPDGYYFSGWALQNGDPVPAVMPANNIEVYGANIPNTVIVTFTGAYTGTQEVPFGGDAVLPVLDVEGVHYTFTVNGEPWDGTNITEDVTVEVGMEIDVYTVQFIDGVTGEVLSTQQVEYADAATAPAAPEHYGYTFAGWDVEFGYITADTTVTAVYDPVTFTVIFTDGLDNIISVQEVPYLGAAEEPEIPVREGWVFTGWDADFSSVTAPMVINATWQEQQITVTFTGSYNGTEIIAYGADCPLPVYNSSSICYTFKVNGEDWCPENLTEDVTVTVSVAPVKTTYHTVTFIGFNGVVISTQSVQHGQAAEIPEAPAVPGYRFVGWDRDVQMLSSVTYTCTRTAIYEKVDDPTPVLLGDVDGDGIVTMADVTLLSMYLNGENPEITAEGMLNADANADGTVDIRDIAAIYQIIANS